tara:strand:+ start:3182 stop:3676 length:495 start_codon:yes stop_codon:yes gene_type:complete
MLYRNAVPITIFGLLSNTIFNTIKMYAKNFSICLILFVVFWSNAQSRTTKEVKVILIVHPKSDTLTQITLFNTFEKMNSADIAKKYPESRFYIGLLSGKYELLHNDNIKPWTGAIISVYTTKQYFPDDELFPVNDIKIGGELALGAIGSKVVSIKKGELTLEIQ